MLANPHLHLQDEKVEAQRGRVSHPVTCLERKWQNQDSNPHCSGSSPVLILRVGRQDGYSEPERRVRVFPHRTQPATSVDGHGVI